jgi:hypothetical protein
MINETEKSALRSKVGAKRKKETIVTIEVLLIKKFIAD